MLRVWSSLLTLRVGGWHCQWKAVDNMVRGCLPLSLLSSTRVVVVGSVSGGLLSSPGLLRYGVRSSPDENRQGQRSEVWAEVSPGRSCDRLDSMTRTTSVDPLHRFRSGGDRDGDREGTGVVT